MAKTKKEKTAPPSTPSKRASKYEKKVKIKGSFEDVMKAMMTPPRPPKEK